MKLMTKAQREKLLANGAKAAEGANEFEMKPAVKWFTPDGAATWLIVSIDPEEPDYAMGIVDLGMGFVEFGGVYIPEVESVRGKLGLPVERDMYWSAAKTTGEYLEEGQAQQRLIA